MDNLFVRGTMAAVVLSTILFLGSAPLLGAQKPAVSHPQTQVIAVVNDEPITTYDLKQRQKLNTLLGNKTFGKDPKVALFLELVDESVRKTEATRLGFSMSPQQLDDAIERLSKGANTTPKALLAKLKAQGISEPYFRSSIEASLLLRAFVSQQSASDSFSVDGKEVDARLKQILSDPRMRPVEVYTVVQIDLPLENTDPSLSGQLLYARMVEGQQIMQNYKGCSSLKAAAQPIYNVKISAPIPAVAEKMPPQMKKALDQVGTKKLLGPMQGPAGVRLLALCGRKTISPPKPDRKMVENLVLNEKYGALTQTMMRDLRRKAFIETKVDWAQKALQ